MKTTKHRGCEQLLRDILAREPRADIHQIRQSHPALSAMSYDQLSLRLSNMLDRMAWG